MKTGKILFSEYNKNSINVQPLIFYSATLCDNEVPNDDEKIIERDNYCKCTLFQTNKYLSCESRKLLISEFHFSKFSTIFLLIIFCGCSNLNKFTNIDCNLCTNYVEDNRAIFDIPYPTLRNIKDSIDILGNQVAAFKLTAIGEPILAQEFFDKYKSTTNEINYDSIPLLYIYDSKLFIDSILKVNRCIFFNEAHHRSDHRNLIEELIPVFVKNGVRRIGFEGFNSTDLEIYNRRYPIIKSGYYTQDPAFGNLIRTALKYDLKIFGYEANSDHEGPAGREEQQANHIIKNTISVDNSKFIVLGGFDHIREDTFLSKSWGGRAMAARFFMNSNINPITIDQYTLSEKKDLHPFYENLGNNNESKIVLFNNIHSKKKFDYYLYHPKLTKAKSIIDGTINLVNLPKYIGDKYFGGLAIVYVYEEFLKEKTIDVLIPVEIISIKKGDNNLTNISKGKFLISIKDELGNTKECLIFNK